MILDESNFSATSQSTIRVPQKSLLVSYIKNIHDANHWLLN